MHHATPNVRPVGAHVPTGVFYPVVYAVHSSRPEVDAAREVLVVSKNVRSAAFRDAVELIENGGYADASLSVVFAQISKSGSKAALKLLSRITTPKQATLLIRCARFRQASALRERIHLPNKTIWYENGAPRAVPRSAADGVADAEVFDTLWSLCDPPPKQWSAVLR